MIVPASPGPHFRGVDKSGHEGYPRGARDTRRRRAAGVSVSGDRRLHMMRDALQERDGVTRIDVRVVAGAPETRFPADYDEWRNRFVAKVSAPARDGAANRELLEAASKRLGVGTDAVRIASGARSKKKALAVVLDADTALERLRDGLEE